MAYLNDNPHLQSLNSIIKFHLEVCWGALSKLGVIDPKIYSHLASIHVSEARCCHRSSKLTLALHIGSPLGVILSLGTFCRRECFLYISILRTLPWIRVLHHMNMHTCLSTNSSTYHPLWASFKCCVPLILLSSFPLTLWRGLSALSEYLTMSDCGKLSSRCPMNSEINCNHINLLVDWVDQVELTDNSNSVYRKMFTWLFHDFGFWMEWVGRELPRRRLWHRSSKQLSWESEHVKGIWSLAQWSRYRHHLNWVFVGQFLFKVIVINLYRSHLITSQWISATIVVLHSWSEEVSSISYVILDKRSCYTPHVSVKYSIPRLVVSNLEPS